MDSVGSNNENGGGLVIFTYLEVINSPQFCLSQLNGHDSGGITQQGGSLG